MLATMAQQQILEIDVVVAESMQMSTDIDLVMPYVEYKSDHIQEIYAIDTSTKVHQIYNNHIPAPLSAKIEDCSENAASFSPCVIKHSSPLSYSNDYSYLYGDHALHHRADSHERYIFKTVDFQQLHIRSFQGQLYNSYALYTRNSSQAHAFIAQIDKHFLEFNTFFDRAQTIKDYQDVYGALQKIELIIDQIVKDKPLSYVLTYDIFHAVKHIELPLLDLFLGNTKALSVADQQQIAWALHGYYKKMAKIFGVKQQSFPSGKLKNIIDDYYRGSIFSKSAKTISYYARKGYRDLIVQKRREQYQQLLEQQAEFLHNITDAKPDVLCGDWTNRYASRQNAVDQSLAEKAFYTRTYNLQDTTRHKLEQLQLDPCVFMQLKGNALQHALQQELVRMANVAAGKEHFFSESLLHFAHTGAEYNQRGDTAQAWKLSDISWMIFDHLQAAGEGAIEGCAHVLNFLQNPKLFVQDAVVSIGKACYELLCYRSYCLDVEARLIAHDEQAITEAALLDLHTQSIKEAIVDALAHMTTREVVKEGVKCFVDYKLTTKLLDCFETLLMDAHFTTLNSLVPASHPIKKAIPQIIYEAIFDAETKSYVVDTVAHMPQVILEAKSLAVAESSAHSMSRYVQETESVITNSAELNLLESFKQNVKTATAILNKEPKVQQAIQLEPIIARVPKKNVCHKDDLLRELKQFQGERFVIDNHVFLLDRKNLKHMLLRHHPRFWDGFSKDTQTFIPKNYKVKDIVEIIDAVFKQNRDTIIKNGTNKKYQIKGIVDKVEYTVGIKKGGLIGQFYIPIKE
jgi:hypothetical protein